MNQQSQLQGKVALVTGAGRGLGECIARALAEAGAIVQVADVRADLAEKVASSIQTSGRRAFAVRMDVGHSEDVDRAVFDVVSRHGHIDAVINNAGVDRTVSIEEMSLEDWNRILATNLSGPFIVSKRVLPLMREQGHGHIVNIVSTAAKRAWANASAYHASKWGLLGFSHALHVEARPYNVKVTSVICGGMRTPFLLERFPDIDLENLQDPKDVAETIRLVLCAPEGTVIPEIMTLPMRETSWP